MIIRGVDLPAFPGDEVEYRRLLEKYLERTRSDLPDVARHVSFPRLNEIVRRKRGVTPDTALRLARVLGMPADFWLGLQQDWDLWHAMRAQAAARIQALKPLRRLRRTMG